jgi:hypothetical protein
MGYNEIEIPVDYYWNVPQGVRYDPHKEPQNLDLGQLTDDWQELQKVLQGDREPFAFDLVWMSTILRAIGEHSLGCPPSDS